MLRYLSYQQLNKKEWDECLAASEQYIVYAASWYLDAVCREWDAVVEEQEGKYVSIFPLPLGRRYGRTCVMQPLFTQQLGLFTTADSKVKDITACLAHIPEGYKYVYLQLNTANTQTLGKLPSAYLAKERVTYHLPLQPGYDAIYKNYRPKHKPKLRKPVAAGLTLKPLPQLESLIDLFRQTKGKELGELKSRHYRKLMALYQALQQHQAAELLQVTDAVGNLHAAALLVHQPDKIIFLFSASSEAGRRSYAMAFLLDSCIRQHAGTLRTFDFEGSMIPEVAKFYSNFGGTPTAYVSLARQHTPWYLSWKNQP